MAATSMCHIEGGRKIIMLDSRWMGPFVSFVTHTVFDYFLIPIICHESVQCTWIVLLHVRRVGMCGYKYLTWRLHLIYMYPQILSTSPRTLKVKATSTILRDIDANPGFGLFVVKHGNRNGGSQTWEKLTYLVHSFTYFFLVLKLIAWVIRVRFISANQL